MQTITVWTRQSENIIQELEKTGRYIAKKEHIMQKMEEHASIYLELYEWYMKVSRKITNIPEDVNYPIWGVVTEATKLARCEHEVMLTLEIPREHIQLITMNKWDHILNYMYIPLNDADKLRHEALLKDHNVSDAKAYLSRFYPNIRREIIASWQRLFEDNDTINDDKTGTFWEVKSEWVTNIEWP